MSGKGYSRKVTVRGGRGRGGFRSYGEHDNRDDRDRGGQQNFGPKRHTSFKRPQNKKRGFYRPRYSDPGPRAHFLDEDDDTMGDGESSSHRRQSPYSSRGRGGQRRWRGPATIDEDKLRRIGVPVSSSALTDGSSWSKISIPHGKKAGKDFLLRCLTENTSVPFVPFHYHTENTTAVFYVNDRAAASALRGLSRTITNAEGFKVVILVNPSAAPSSPLDKEVVEHLKVCMSRRYNIDTKVLDLSSFTQDSELKQKGIFLPLNKINVASAVLDAVAENIPGLEGLDLSKNRLYSLQAWSSLSTKAPKLSRLNIGHNQLKTIADLDNIKQLSLVEIQLEGNPVAQRYSDNSRYVSDIKKRFPKMLLLDGKSLPPTIGFDVEAEPSIPPTQGSYFLNEPVKDLVCKFLDQYFGIYDSGNRQPLLDAYHDQCVFSLSAFNNKLNMNRQGNLSEYFQLSRNLFRVHDTHKQQKLLKVGKLNVVSLLCELPASQHDPASYVVDVNLSSDTLLCFSVHGLFKESESKVTPQPIRSFTRTFIAVPLGAGIAIANEEFVLAQASPISVKTAFKNPAPTPSSSPVAGASPLAPDVQQQMVKQFSQQSGMNPDWSSKCLVQNEWDYDKSAKAFAELQAKGVIPQEAFVKS